jgi:thiamine biosynthesis lipoprotein
MPAARLAPSRRLVYRTRAWSTGVELMVTDPSCLVGATTILHDEIERMDLLASRFRAHSEISRVNRGAGSEVRVSAGFVELMAVADRVARATGGAVDPTVGAALCRLGYDRDFAAIADGVVGELPSPAPVAGWRSVEIDVVAGTVTIPPGAALDLGATAKALTADRVADAVARRLGCGVLVSLGGDVAVAGSPPPEGFSVGVGTHWSETDPPVAVSIRSGGLATSGISARSWRLGRSVVHHLLDPMTGLPVAPCWSTVAVAASSCVDANAASTAAVVKGASAVSWLESLGLSARLVAVDGSVSLAAGWPDDDAVTGPESGASR